MLLAVREYWSVAWPEGHDGYYYWQHCAYVDNSDWVNTAAMHADVAPAMQLYYTDQCRQHATRFYYPNTFTLFAAFDYTFVGHGANLPVENPNLLMCARWRMRGSDGSYTYHLHRRPIGDDDLIDGVWSDDGYLRQVATMNTFIGHGIWRTQTGAFITEGEVAPLPVPWQLRHGTKRRSRRFGLTT